MSFSVILAKNNGNNSFNGSIPNNQFSIKNLIEWPSPRMLLTLEENQKESDPPPIIKNVIYIYMILPAKILSTQISKKLWLLVIIISCISYVNFSYSLIGNE
jgi:hypothetical protein